MPRYNRQFDLSIADVGMIEEALRARGRELSRMRLALSEETGFREAGRSHSLSG